MPTPPGQDQEIAIPLPATPGLAQIKEVVITFGPESQGRPIDLSISRLHASPIARHLAVKELGVTPGTGKLHAKRLWQTPTSSISILRIWGGVPESFILGTASKGKPKGASMTLRLGLGPVFAYEWLRTTRRWTMYAWRAGFVLVLLGGLALVWLAESHHTGPPTMQGQADLAKMFFGITECVAVVTVLLAAPAAGNERVRGTHPERTKRDPPGSSRWPLWARAATRVHSAFRPFLVFIDSRKR